MPLHIPCSHLGIYVRKTLTHEPKETCIKIFIEAFVEGQQIQNFLSTAGTLSLFRLIYNLIYSTITWTLSVSAGSVAQGGKRLWSH